MKCENYLCIYQDQGECTIKVISLDIVGMCTECIYPNIDKNILKELKKTTLGKLWYLIDC